MKFKKICTIIILSLCCTLFGCSGQPDSSEFENPQQQKMYWIGDTINMSDGIAVKVTRWDRDNYWDDAGNGYTTIDYEIKNNSDAAVEITNGSFNVYVDDYKVEQRAVEDGNVLNGIVLNAGKKASGTIYVLCDDINFNTAHKIEVVYGQDGIIKLFDKDESLPYITKADGGIHLDEFANLDSKAVSMILKDDYEVSTKGSRKDSHDIYTTDAGFNFSVIEDSDGYVMSTVFEITEARTEKPVSIYGVTYDMGFNDAIKQLEHAGGTFFDGEYAQDGDYSFVIYEMSEDVSVTMFRGQSNIIGELTMCVSEYGYY